MTTTNERRQLLEAHFGGRSDTGDIWQALEFVLPTDQYLNLGYSTPYQSHILGSPQARLIDLVLGHFRNTVDLRHPLLLDLGCGRGAPTTRMATKLDIPAVGVDFVRHNIASARDRHTDSAEFFLGTAEQLPFVHGAVTHLTAIDTIVYASQPKQLFEEIHRVLRPNGRCVVTDLLYNPRAGIDTSTVDSFCDQWSMPQLRTPVTYRTKIAEAGLTLESERDLRPHSVGRFRKWTSLFLKLCTGPLQSLLTAVMDDLNLNANRVVSQIAAAHTVLPALEHRLFVLSV